MAIGYAAAVAAMKAGDRLFVSYPCGDKPGEKPTWALLGASKIVSVTAVRRLMDGGMIPLGDGMFGDSQTYVLPRDE